MNESLDETNRIIKAKAQGYDGTNLVTLKVDSNGVLATETEGSGAVGTGTKTVTTAGTRVQMTAQACRRVFIQALSSNSGVLVIGGAAVVAAEATRQGLALYATQGAYFNVNNMNLLYIDSTSNGDKCHFYYEN